MTDPYRLPEPYQYNPGAVEHVIVAIGDISVTRTTVILPQGRFHLRGTSWNIQDSTQVTESASGVGMALAIVSVVLAVLLAFCTFGLSLILLLGLLFLLMKDRRVSGFVAISVAGHGFYHSIQLPPGEHSAAWATSQVNQARAVAAMA